MRLRNAAFFALVATAIWAVLTAVILVRNLAGVVNGYIPAVTLLTSVIQFLVALSLVVFFAVFHNPQS
jgi:hypothetical protein